MDPEIHESSLSLSALLKMSEFDALTATFADSE